jgi:hypothetical protein
MRKGAGAGYTEGRRCSCAEGQVGSPPAPPDKFNCYSPCKLQHFTPWFTKDSLRPFFFLKKKKKAIEGPKGFNHICLQKEREKNLQNPPSN